MPFSVRISYRGSGGPREAVRTVPRFSRVTIGRASDCDIVLDDPQRHVSRVHAVVTSRDGEYVLSVVSKVNYVLVNGRQLAPDSSTTVRAGDRIEIGQYSLEVLTGALDETSHAQTVKLAASAVAPANVHAARVRPPRGKGLIESLAQDVPIVPEPAAAAPPATKPEQDPLRTFLEGAGIAGLQPPADSDRSLRECGAMLRAAIEGIIGLLRTRADMKDEMRAEDRTTTAAQDNNPLKLMSDVQEALGYLIDPQARKGPFLPPLRAVQDACEDLRTHQLALMAAMRVAIMGAIERFEPGRLEELMTEEQTGSALNRKARLWDLFVAHQAKLAREARENTNQAFAAEFLQTYAAQVKRLRSKR